ncbi:SNF2 family N-terminal domain-domain-containing protein [Absidia repens]|uniref:SNF2 family N-terminal domain-domain-containing protein n=1 Tax=Absidia repens TaxID=90262 RepID=A0A1X2IEJ7_9FUNG|nr:SNF2 family N-terminal domain-domain-containing protein [Absidia repens]
MNNTNVIHNQGATDKEVPKVAINALTNDSQPIYIHPHFLKFLKNHQINGIRFMWKQVIGEANGCVLAHCMGLGKTIQVIVLVATIFQEIEKGNISIPGDILGNKVLIIAPLITLANWLNEFDKWLPPDIISNISHIFNSAELAGVQEDRRVQYIRKWYNDGGIMLMSYDQFRSLLTSVRQADYEDMLLKPSLVILDEAHRIKTPTASVTRCVNMIQTPRRICLTGYPLQNNLAEYYCMIEFIYPGLLGDDQHFKKEFKKPIESIYADSSMYEKHQARLKLLHLQLLTGDIIQRKDASILNQELPGKTEYLISCQLTPMQYNIYLKLLELCRSCHTPILLSIMLFRCLCNHPSIFKEALIRNAKNSGLYNHPSNGTASLTDTDAEVNDQDEYATVNKFAKKEMRDWKNYGYADDTDVDNWNQSHKMRMILSLSRLCKDKKEKLVIVSHSIVSLNFIQTILSVNGFVIDRIDGSTPQGERQPIIDRFNDLESSEIMLLSAKAGGIGVNITGASRMILVDSDWNPSHDEQSIGRIYRFGQTKRVFIYRLLAYSTVESIILKQGAHKQGISNRVIDNKLSKLVMEKELRHYYRPPEEDPARRIKRKTLKKINDPVLKEALQAHASSVVEVEINGPMSNLGCNSRGTLDRVELTPATLRDIQHATIEKLRNARFQHRRAFISHM